MKFFMAQEKVMKGTKTHGHDFLMALQWHFHYLQQGMAPLTQMP